MNLASLNGCKPQLLQEKGLISSTVGAQQGIEVVGTAPGAEVSAPTGGSNSYSVTAQLKCEHPVNQAPHRVIKSTPCGTGLHPGHTGVARSHPLQHPYEKWFTPRSH